MDNVGAVVINRGETDTTGILVLILIEVLNQVITVFVVFAAEIRPKVKLPLVLIVVVVWMGICNLLAHRLCPPSRLRDVVLSLDWVQEIN